MANNQKPLVTNKFENVQKKYKFHSNTAAATIGQGSFGVVRKCRHWRTKQEYACKTIAKSSTPPELLKREVSNLQRINLTNRSSRDAHPHLLQLIDVHEDPKFVHLITEVCHGGELYERVVSSSKNTSSSPFSDADAAWVIRNILLGIAYLHTVPKIVHRDLKASNFLFVTSQKKTNNRSVKIIDFGLSKHVPTKSRCHACRTAPLMISPTSSNTIIDENDSLTAASTFESIPEDVEFMETTTTLETATTTTTKTIRSKTKQGQASNSSTSNNTALNTFSCDCHLGRLSTKVGTPYYVAPEVMKQESYTNKCDVWSVGCIAYFVLQASLPFQAATEKETLDLIQRDDCTELLFFGEKNNNNDNNNATDEHNNVVSPLAMDFCKCLLEIDPQRRPSAERALYHPWLMHHCGEPPVDLKGNSSTTTTTRSNNGDSFDDDDDDDSIPQWGAVSRLGARIASDSDAIDIMDSERSATSNGSKNGFFLGKIFRKAKSSFLP